MPIDVNGFSCTLADGIRETTQTTGTGTYSLDGAATVDGVTYRTFVAGVSSGVRTIYSVRLGAEFENGIGTVTSGAPATLSRDSILSSSNSGNAVNWGTGVKDVLLGPVTALFHSLQAAINALNSLTSLTFGPTTLTGSFIDFTSIPAGAREIDIGITASFTGNNSLIVQGGVSGTPETSGYTAGSGAIVDAGASAVLSDSSGWVVRMGDNTLFFHGTMKLIHMGSNLWVQSHTGRFGPNSTIVGGGSKTFAGQLDMLRFTRNGSDTFDGVSVLATVKF